MNCEHGIDIDEYTCTDCKKYMENFWNKEEKDRLKAIKILKPFGLSHWVKE